MAAMLKDTVLRSDISATASAVLVGVVILYGLIARWATRPASRNEFARASRMPFETEENENER